MSLFNLIRAVMLILRGSFVLLLAMTVHCFGQTTDLFGVLTPEEEEILIQILSFKTSRVEAVVQSVRKLLQRARLWQNSHPAESALGKCLIHYCIEVKIPDLMAITDSDEENDGRRGLLKPVWIREEEDANLVPVDLFMTEGAEFSGRSLNQNELLKRKLIKAFYMAYINFKNLLQQQKLLSCSFQYLLSKFWEWVDTAP